MNPQAAPFRRIAGIYAEIDVPGGWVVGNATDVRGVEVESFEQGFADCGGVEECIDVASDPGDLTGHSFVLGNPTRIVRDGRDANAVE